MDGSDDEQGVGPEWRFKWVRPGTVDGRSLPLAIGVVATDDGPRMAIQAGDGPVGILEAGLESQLAKDARDAAMFCLSETGGL